MDRILVVDDEADIVNLTRMILEKEGYGVSSATNGDDALRKIQTEPPNLVLLDLIMPGKSGFEVCKIIKEQPKTRNIPVIVFTALGRDVDRKLTRLAGADAHFTKPFAKPQLLNVVGSWLKEARASGFSRRIGIEHEKLIGKKILLEVDPRSDYEKAAMDFIVELSSRNKTVVVVTQDGSPIRQCLDGYDKAKVLDLNPQLMFSPILKAHSHGMLGIVVDSLTDLVLKAKREEDSQSWLYKFAQNSLQVLSDDRITALFLLNPSAHEARTVASIRGLFKNQVAYDAEGIRVIRLL